MTFLHGDGGPEIVLGVSGSRKVASADLVVPSSASDLTAYLTAAASLLPAGGRLILSEGTFPAFVSSWTVPVGITLEGQGEGTKVPIDNPLNVGLVALAVSSGSRVRGMHLFGSASGRTGQALALSGGSGVRASIEDVTGEHLTTFLGATGAVGADVDRVGCTDTGSGFLGSSASLVTLRDPDLSADAPIVMNTGDRLKVLGGRLSNAGGGHDTVLLNAATQCEFDGLTLVGDSGWDGYRFVGGGHHRVRGGDVSGVHQGIGLDSSSFNEFIGTEVVVGSANPDAAVILRATTSGAPGCTFNRFIGMTLLSPAEAGFAAGLNATDGGGAGGDHEFNDLIDCLIRFTGSGNASEAAVLLRGFHDGQILGNRIHDFAGQPAVYTQWSSSRNRIAGQRIENCAQGIVLGFGSTDGTANVVDGNVTHGVPSGQEVVATASGNHLGTNYFL